MAGNDTEGLRYGTIGTPEKMYLAWKEDEADNAGMYVAAHLYTDRAIRRCIAELVERIAKTSKKKPRR